MNTTGICHITLAGNVATKLRFGMPACRMFSDMALEANPENMDGISITEIGISKLLYFGYKNNRIVEELPVEFTFSVFVEYVEDQILQEDKSEMEQAIDCFYQSRLVSKYMASVDEAIEEGKKKLIGTKLNPLPFVSSNLPQSNMPPVHTVNISLGKKAKKGKLKKK